MSGHRHAARRPRRPALAVLGAVAAVGTFAVPVVTGADPALAAPAAAASAQPLCASVVASDEATCFALRLVKQGASPFTATPSGYGPADIQSAYALPAGGGQGTTVAIVDAYDDPNAAADLAAYRQTYGLPALRDGQLRKVSQRGTTTDLPAPDSGWAGEITLDLDAVTAVAPQADILLVETDSAKFTDLGAGVNEAVALGAKYVSNSYGSTYTNGSGEDPAELDYDQAYYNHPGVAVVASTGDYDYGVSYPAASRYVTSAGGTSLTRDTSARGWSESAWGNDGSGHGTGSGCSAVEPKPAFQTDTGCSKRTLADVSMVADPNTGLAIYDTYQSGGWEVAGGTSLSSPLLTATYALAGVPTSGSYPNSYPYADHGHLNDVVSGSNGSCGGSYLCTSGAGYDGPTGLGTPNGVLAFAPPDYGTLTGTITDATTGAAIAGATVTAGTGTAAASTTTGTDGTYALPVAPGTYRPVVSLFGYATRTLRSVTVTKNVTTRVDGTLAPLARRVLSGTVADGSGHRWPLYSHLTFAGVPGTGVYTDPFTGRYTVSLPTGLRTSMTVSAIDGGYQSVSLPIAVGSADITRNVAVPVDGATRDALGYTFGITGSTQTFSAGSIPAGWTTTNLNGGTDWAFDDPTHRGNDTPGSGGFATIDSLADAPADSENTTLNTPVVDMSKVVSPVLTFDSAIHNVVHGSATIELSVDGGTTWTTAGQVYGDSESVTLPLPAAAGHGQVQVRFHYQGHFDFDWQVDNVRLGQVGASVVRGGIVAGRTTDVTTQQPIDGVTVRTGTVSTTSRATGDPAFPHGYYRTFSAASGSTLAFTATRGGYTTTAGTATVAANAVTRLDFALTSGRAAVTQSAITVTTPWRGRVSRTLTVRNTGTAPVTVQATEGPGSFTLASGGTARPTVVRADTSAYAGSLAVAAEQGRLGRAATQGVAPADGSWAALPDIPNGYIGNAAVAYNGKVYSVGGYAGGHDTGDLWAYDTGARTWTQLTSATRARESAAVVAYDGKLYVLGGLTDTGAAVATVDIYDIATDTWTSGPVDPNPSGGTGFGVVGHSVYLVGGCTATTNCGSTQTETFDLATGTFARAADYPAKVWFTSCGGIGDHLYCAGGATKGDDGGTVPISLTYQFDPSTGTWSRLADVPADPGFGAAGAWGAITAVADGQLLVGGGVIGAGIWNGAFGYDPATDTWTVLPPLTQTVFRGGGAVGWFQVGGGIPSGATTAVTVLPEFNQSETSQVSWMSEDTTRRTIAPGRSATIAVTLDASDPSITQPGTLISSIGLITDSPYPVASVPVSFTVQAPTTWGEITGVVTGTRKGQTTPLSGATVRVNTWAGGYTLTTDTDGRYALFLDARSNPLKVIVAKDGYVPQSLQVAIKAGATRALDVALVSS